MPDTPNPFFDPDLAAALPARQADCAAWQSRCSAIAENEGFASPRHLAALDRQHDSKMRLKAAQLSQFRTIAAYAAWRFAALPESKDGFFAAHDFAAFTSIADVEAACERADRTRREGGLANGALLDTRQPQGLIAFSEFCDVISSWRGFDLAEAGAAPVECLVSFCQTGETLHFCLAHRWGGLSRHSNEQFRQMATTLARQAIGFSMEGAEILFRHGAHRLAKNRDLIREVNRLAKRFVFYRHLWPHRALKEQFSRVDMVWEGAKYIDPDWSAELFASLPTALRDAAGNFPEQSPMGLIK